MVVVNASRRQPRIIGGTEPERGEGRGEVDRLVTYLYRGGFVLCPLSLLAKVAALGNLQTDKHTNFEHYTIEGSRLNNRNPLEDIPFDLGACEGVQKERKERGRQAL